MPKYTECILSDKPCTDCNMCDMCDLNSSKVCNNCFDCLDKKEGDYASIAIDEMLTEDNSLILDEIDLNELQKEAENPMDFITDDGLTLDVDAYDSELDEDIDPGYYDEEEED